MGKGHQQMMNDCYSYEFVHIAVNIFWKKFHDNPHFGPFWGSILGPFLTENKYFWALKLGFCQNGQGAPTDDE